MPDDMKSEKESEWRFILHSLFMQIIFPNGYKSLLY